VLERRLDSLTARKKTALYTPAKGQKWPRA